MTDACNCVGEWGAGVALQLKKEFPNAYDIYYDHCQDKKHEELLGTCLLISPQAEDRKLVDKEVFIACLFTSKGYGRKNVKKGNPGLSNKDEVLAATKTALGDFKEQVNQRQDNSKGDDGPLFIASVKFNAGSFKVPWEETRAQIEEIFGDYKGTWTVVSPR